MLLNRDYLVLVPNRCKGPKCPIPGPTQVVSRFVYWYGVGVPISFLGLKWTRNTAYLLVYQPILNHMAVRSHHTISGKHTQPSGGQTRIQTVGALHGQTPSREDPGRQAFRFVKKVLPGPLLTSKRSCKVGFSVVHGRKRRSCKVGFSVVHGGQFWRYVQLLNSR